MKGRIDSIEDIKLLKEGQNKKGGLWKLYGTHIIVDGVQYGLTDFSETELDKKLEDLNYGDVIEFETEQQGEYTNIKQKAEIKKLESAVTVTNLPKPTPGALTKEECQALWKECMEFVTKELKGKIAVEGFDQIGPSINTLFMRTIEERKRRR